VPHKIIGSDQVVIQEVLVLELLKLSNTPGVIIEKSLLMLALFPATGKCHHHPEEKLLNLESVG